MGDLGAFVFEPGAHLVVLALEELGANWRRLAPSWARPPGALSRRGVGCHPCCILALITHVVDEEHIRRGCGWNLTRFVVERAERESL